MNTMLLTDFYKVHHNRMYPDNMTKLYSNFTPRKSRMKGVDKVVVFGIQHFILEYLIKNFNKKFFGKSEKSSIPAEHGGGYERTNKSQIVAEYSQHCRVNTEHLEALWDLGYLPIRIKALPEGTLCPIGVPVLTITNTHPDFAWLTNYLETLLSCMLWQPMTSATIAHEYRKLLLKYAKETDEKNTAFVEWQGHDFSMRGMSSVESAILSGMGHLVSFKGTDTIPAIYQLETSYNATGLIGASVPATEHSVMCMGTKESEIETFKRLLKLYPTGILSVVSDTWDLWKVLTEYLPAIKSEIMNRDVKLVIRPDSGDPVDIICGINSSKSKHASEYWDKTNKKDASWKGVIELLWDVFGGTTNSQGYKVLDPHIGAIYGDSITLERAEAICERLKAKGFASTNIVFGIGSYTYQYNTRDTFGFAMKATYGEITHKCSKVKKRMECLKHDYPYSEAQFADDGSECTSFIEEREIFKAPVTDSGEKKSAKGLLSVEAYANRDEGFLLGLKQSCTKEQEEHGMLRTVFEDGKLMVNESLDTIRERLEKQIK